MYLYFHVCVHTFKNKFLYTYMYAEIVFIFSGFAIRNTFFYLLEKKSAKIEPLKVVREKLKIWEAFAKYIDFPIFFMTLPLPALY